MLTGACLSLAWQVQPAGTPPAAVTTGTPLTAPPSMVSPAAPNEVRVAMRPFLPHRRVAAVRSPHSGPCECSSCVGVAQTQIPCRLTTRGSICSRTETWEAALLTPPRSPHPQVPRSPTCAGSSASSGRAQVPPNSRHHPARASILPFSFFIFHSFFISHIPSPKPLPPLTMGTCRLRAIDTQTLTPPGKSFEPSLQK